MPLELLPDALGDIRNARALAVASDLAYYTEAEGQPAFREQLGLEAKLFSAGNTQVFLATSPAHIVLAFRGTEAPTSLEGLKDWLLSDAVNLLVQPTGELGAELVAFGGVGSRWHLGFTTAIASIWPSVFPALEAEIDKAERPIWVTGHSLGGALALMAACLLERATLPACQVYTFGAPMVGNAAAADAFNKQIAGRIFRYVDSVDPIPMLPTMSLIANQYAHCEKEMGQSPAPSPSLSAAAFWQEFGKKAVNGILSGTLLDEAWEAVKARAEAHSMVNYRKLTGE